MLYVRDIGIDKSKAHSNQNKNNLKDKQVVSKIQNEMNCDMYIV